jgi:hypothetical protein
MYFIHHSGIKMDQFDDHSSSEIKNNDEIEIDEESAHILDVVTGLKTFLTFHIRLFRRLNNIYN